MVQKSTNGIHKITRRMTPRTEIIKVANLQWQFADSIQMSLITGVSIQIIMVVSSLSLKMEFL